MTIQKRAQRAPKSRQTGFTLVEVLIVSVIIAILTMIAYSSYQDSLVRTRRSAAQGCLLENSQFMERFYTTNLRYDQDRNGVAVPAPTCTAGNDVNNFYAVTFAAAPTATTFSLRAVPAPAQAARDTKCMTMTINQTGTKTESGTGSVDDCW
ncbi:MAG: type IV pilin protein [Lysobacter sp.]|nr:type IV pilin protein [Lysobacter sp.]